MNKNVQFISVWNDGFEVITSAKWNLETNEVYDIESSESNVDAEGDELEFLDEQYILSDGKRYELATVHEGFFVQI